MANYAGPIHTVTNDISIVVSKDGVKTLSNGDPIRHGAMRTIELLNQFPVSIFYMLGLCQMTELIGRFLEIRKSKPRL